MKTGDIVQSKLTAVPATVLKVEGKDLFVRWEIQNPYTQWIAKSQVKKLVRRKNPDEDLRRLERLAAQGDIQAGKKLLAAQNRQVSYEVETAWDNDDQGLYRVYRKTAFSKLPIGTLFHNKNTKSWWNSIISGGQQYYPEMPFTSKQAALDYVLENQERALLTNWPGHPPAGSRRNPPEGLSLNQARKWIQEGLFEAVHNNNKEYLRRLIASTQSKDQDKLQAEIKHAYEQIKKAAKQWGGSKTSRNPPLAIIEAGLSMFPNPPIERKIKTGNRGKLEEDPRGKTVTWDYKGNRYQGTVVGVSKNNQGWIMQIQPHIGSEDYISLFNASGFKASHTSGVPIELALSAVRLVENNPKRKNPGRKNPGKKNPGVQTGGVIGDIDLADFIRDNGMTDELQTAIKAYKKLHQAEPTKISVFKYNNGHLSDEQKIVVAVGQVPETHYTIPNGMESNKEGSHWVHAHKAGNLPYLLMDPTTGILMTAGGEFSTTDWIREKSAKR